MKKFLTLITLALLALALSGCGGGGGGSSTTINVTLTDFQFNPNTFTVPAGAQITLHATNNGAVQHSFIIMKKGDEIKEQFTEADMANAFWAEKMIDPGQTVTDTFTAPSDPGEYQIVCHVAGHFQAGMVAKLIVVQP